VHGGRLQRLDGLERSPGRKEAGLDAEAARVEVTRDLAAVAAEHRPWLIRRLALVVGVRLAIDERRRRKRWGLLPIRETDQEWAMTTDPDLWRALAQLDRRTRAALVLTVLDGYTQDEVAEMMSVPRGTVASWLSRGKARLRSVLDRSER
jgi:RNA polymerase sigma-70 factor (ECF subfamily)